MFLVILLILLSKVSTKDIMALSFTWKISFLKNFMTPFYGWGSTVSRLQSHNEETVYVSPLRSQEFLALIRPTSEGRKAELTLEPTSGFEPLYPWIENPVP